jgi:hypothetical protein
MAVTEPVTVIINNCNLLTWPRVMVAAIEGFADLDSILIVDKGSTYPPLLDWYASRRARGHDLPHLRQAPARQVLGMRRVNRPSLHCAPPALVGGGARRRIPVLPRPRNRIVVVQDDRALLGPP